MYMYVSRKVKRWASVVVFGAASLGLQVSGFQGFWPVLIVCVGAVIWSLFLFREELSQIRIIRDPNEGPPTERPVWLILPGVAMVLLVLYPFTQLYLTATGYIKPLTFDDLLQTYIHDRSLYVTELARTDVLVRGKIFENVTFVGPATIAIKGSSMDDIHFLEVADGKVENLFLEIPPTMRVTGLIIFENCIFRRCRFQRVQVVGTKEFFEQMKAAIHNK